MEDTHDNHIKKEILVVRNTQKPRNTQPLVYLAGKIAKNDWRNEARDLGFNVTGPNFVSCDHGCCHGDSLHGVGAWGYPIPNDEIRHASCVEAEETRYGSRIKTVDDCLGQIRAADVMYVWAGDFHTAYGTLAEIGYARGRRKYVIIATDDPDALKDQWFAVTMADAIIYAPAPIEGLHAAFGTGVWK